jgi:hypothetical protein
MSLGSPTLVQRAWRTKYVCSTSPSWSTIMMTVKKFEKTGSEKEILVKNVKIPKYPRKIHARKTFTFDQKSKPDS